MLISVNSCIPVYAEDNGVYTLEPGKVYRFRTFLSGNVVVEFSDYVLCSFSPSNLDYKNVRRYKYDNYISGNSYFLSVYNTNSKSVTMTMIEGTTDQVSVFESPLSLVMYDATETDFQIINNTGNYVYAKQFEYDESDRSFDASGDYFAMRDTKTFTGVGFILFAFPIDDLPYNLEFNGVYEISNYVGSGFFPVPPWILRMDLAGTIRVLLDQLSMLLPVGLVILLVFLLASLLIYMVHLFL
jgi:hypothetical protein